MVSFFFNICKFDGCGTNFSSLFDLINHIEIKHINYDPEFIEKQERSQPESLPLSYILPFTSENASKERIFLSNKIARIGLTQNVASRCRRQSRCSSNCSKSSTYKYFKSFTSAIPVYTKHCQNANGIRYHSQKVYKGSGLRCRSLASLEPSSRSNTLTSGSSCFVSTSADGLENVVVESVAKIATCARSTPYCSWIVSRIREEHKNSD
ncbi:uncharacterized protein ACN427_011424 [Glossina fuscipes fuscipes]